MIYTIVQFALEYGVMLSQGDSHQLGCILIKEDGTASCSTGWYPILTRTSKGVYVLIAQDDLNTLGFKTGGLDGIYGNQTANAVREYQRSVGLSADGIVGCNTWRYLQESVFGTGRTSTTID